MKLPEWLLATVRSAALNVTVTSIALLFMLNVQVALPVGQLMLEAPPTTPQVPMVEGAVGVAVKLMLSLLPVVRLQLLGQLIQLGSPPLPCLVPRQRE